MLDQRLDAVVDGVEEPADKAGIQILVETKIKERVERITIAALDDLGDRTVGEPGILRLRRRGDDDPVPIALEDRARPRVAQVVAELIAEALVAENRLQLLAVISLDRVEGRVAVERVGRREREIERQRLAGELKIDLLPPLLRCRAGL